MNSCATLSLKSVKGEQSPATPYLAIVFTRLAGSTPPWLLPPVNLLTGGVCQEEMPSPPNSKLDRAGWHLQVRLTVPFIRAGLADNQHSRGRWQGVPSL